MPELIEKPTRIEPPGNKPKLIDEYVGRVNSETEAVKHCTYAIAHWLDGTRSAPAVR